MVSGSQRKVCRNDSKWGRFELQLNLYRISILNSLPVADFTQEYRTNGWRFQAEIMEQWGKSILALLESRLVQFDNGKIILDV